MSPRCQIASTAPAWARTASRASRLLWTSEMTAIRIPANLAAGRSPGPALACARIPGKGVGHPALGGRDDQLMAFEAGHTYGMDRQAPAAQGRHGTLGRRKLHCQVATFPGHENAARRKQREGKLDELREARDRPSRDRRPAPAMPFAA